MRSTLSGWEVELAQWLKPFLDRLGHKARRRMCPLYVTGLIGPGDRKSVQPMAERLAPGDYDQLHHFVAAGVWDAAPLETELLIQADRLVGGSDAVLVIDDTAVPKKGKHSVGVASQYASALGKNANCQTLVSLTLARARRGTVDRGRHRQAAGPFKCFSLQMIARRHLAHGHVTIIAAAANVPKSSCMFAGSFSKEATTTRTNCSLVTSFGMHALGA